ncbi:TPA: hypothetical protein LVL65_001011 [Klebsiella oxytoca]|nr:hypothetical protein [Klebsiella oxytoca]
MNIETVNELIQSLESAGELSIKETKVMALAKAYLDVAAENAELKEDRDTLARYWIEDGGDEDCFDYLDTDCVMDRLDISYEDAEKRTSGAIEFHDAMVNFANQLREGADK